MSSNDKIKIRKADVGELNPIKTRLPTNKKDIKNQDDKYHLINSENKMKKISKKTIIIVTFELSFLIVTFILVFRKAMNSLLQNHKQEIEDIPATPKKNKFLNQLRIF